MKRFNALLAAALIGVSLAAGAHQGETHSKKVSPVRKEQKDWGIAGEAKAVNRTIVVTMTDDMRFTPDWIEVKQGETIRFVHKNAGKIMHEFVIGTKKDLDEHAAMMLKFPSMEHDEPYMAHVGSENTGEIIWKFNRPGEFDFACLIAGHYQSGMVGKINVAAAVGERSAKGQEESAGATSTAAASDMADAVVRKVDKENKKITLKHGAIKSLDMPPMTMVFQVKDAAMLDKLQPGDKVRFNATDVSGKLTVTEIELVK